MMTAANSSSPTISKEASVPITNKQVSKQRTLVKDPEKTEASFPTELRNDGSQSIYREKYNLENEELKVYASYLDDHSVIEIRKLQRDCTRRSLGASFENILDNLTQERQELVLKNFKSGLKSSEKKRLNYIEWQINQIEDAFYGEGIDQLELLLVEREQLGKRIEGFVRQVQEIIPSRKRK